MDEYRDDDLTKLTQSGIPPLPPDGDSGVVFRGGASLWCASWGSGPAVLLLHGGLGNAGNWGHQVPDLLAAGYRVLVMDTRGHGRSSWDGTPFSYHRLAEDALAVLEHFGVARAAIVGWSDGADAGLILAMTHPERVAGLVFFACNVDDSGTKPFEMTDIIDRIFARHVADHAALSPDPGGFDIMQEAVGLMQGSQPNLTAADLNNVTVPVLSLIGEHDEFITRAHAEYLAAAIPGARFELLPDVSHFAPLQRPALFNAAVMDFLARVSPR